MMTGHRRSVKYELRMARVDRGVALLQYRWRMIRCMRGAKKRSLEPRLAPMLMASSDKQETEAQQELIED